MSLRSLLYALARFLGDVGASIGAGDANNCSPPANARQAGS